MAAIQASWSIDRGRPGHDKAKARQGRAGQGRAGEREEGRGIGGDRGEEVLWDVVHEDVKWLVG